MCLATAEGTIFPPDIDNCKNRPASCAQTYNVTVLPEREFWNRYHLGPEELNNSTRIIFSVAELDPNSGVIMGNPPLSSDPCRSRRLFASGMAHREDLFLPRHDDKEVVVTVLLRLVTRRNGSTVLTPKSIVAKSGTTDNEGLVRVLLRKSGDQFG